MRYIFLELPSFNKEESECNTDFERWIYVLKDMETLKRLPFKARNAVFQKLEQIVDIAALSKEDRIKYDESIKVYRDNLAVMAFERQQGRAEGRAEGIVEGEQKAQIRIAREMKEKGLPVELISQITKLAVEEVEKL